MDPITAIETALVAGATASDSGVASKAVTDAFDRLEVLLAKNYAFASATLLKKKPTNPTYRDAVQAELRGVPDIIGDETVLKEAQAVHEALKHEHKENLDARKLLKTNPDYPLARHEFVAALGSVSYTSLFVRNYAAALTLSNQAIEWNQKKLFTTPIKHMR